MRKSNQVFHIFKPSWISLFSLASLSVKGFKLQVVGPCKSRHIWFAPPWDNSNYIVQVHRPPKPLRPIFQLIPLIQLLVCEVLLGLSLIHSDHMSDGKTGGEMKNADVNQRKWESMRRSREISTQIDHAAPREKTKRAIRANRVE